MNRALSTAPLARCLGIFGFVFSSPSLSRGDNLNPSVYFWCFDFVWFHLKYTQILTFLHSTSYFSPLGLTFRGLLTAPLVTLNLQVHRGLQVSLSRISNAAFQLSIANSVPLRSKYPKQILTLRKLRPTASMVFHKISLLMFCNGVKHTTAALVVRFVFRVREAPQPCFLWRPKQASPPSMMQAGSFRVHLWRYALPCMPAFYNFLALLAFQIQPPPAFAVANSMQTETEFFFCRGKVQGHKATFLHVLWVCLWWILWDQAMMPRTWDHQNWAFNNLLRFWSDGLKELEELRSIWKLPDLNIHVFDTRRI